MNAWLRQLSCFVPDRLFSPSEVARFELDHALPGVSVSLVPDPDLGEGYCLTRTSCGWSVRGGKTGLLYGAYALILKTLSGQSVPDSFSSAPFYPLRMVNCWDNMDGSVERGYSGRSLFFEGGHFSYDPERMRELGRLLASCGLNVLCINNVNVHEPAQCLLEDLLPEAAALADIFRPFGVRLMLSVDFSRPLKHGIPTADPLDPAVRSWWRETASRVGA